MELTSGCAKCRTTMGLNEEKRDGLAFLTMWDPNLDGSLGQTHMLRRENERCFLVQMISNLPALVLGQVP